MKQALCALLGSSMLTLPAAVLAQSAFPEKPVRIVVGFIAGGSSADLIARLVGPRLSEWWKQPVIVENMPGQVANIAAARVAKAPPDGHTMVATGDAALTTNVALYGKQLPYDPTKDLVPITLVALSTNILVVHPSVPVRSVKDLVALAKANPGKLTYGSAGSGSSQHLGGELLKKRAGIDMLHVPYKGGALALQDLMAGRIDLTFGNVVTMLPHVQAGRLRGIAVSSIKRWPAVPDIPTVAESGYPGFEAVAWFGFSAPGGTPNLIVQKLYQDIAKALAIPEVRTRLTDTGLDVVALPPEKFLAQVKAEIVAKGQLIKDAGAKPD